MVLLSKLVECVCFGVVVGVVGEVEPGRFEATIDTTPQGPNVGQGHSLQSLARSSSRPT